MCKRAENRLRGRIVFLKTCCLRIYLLLTMCSPHYLYIKDWLRTRIIRQINVFFERLLFLKNNQHREIKSSYSRCEMGKMEGGFISWQTPHYHKVFLIKPWKSKRNIINFVVTNLRTAENQLYITGRNRKS